MRNRGYAYTATIGNKHEGQTLLTHLASQYPHSSPQEWNEALHRGEVTLDGVVARGDEAVASGQSLVWNRPPWIEPDAPQQYNVLFEDAHLLAVNKPAGLPTLPGGGFMENTLLRLVQQRVRGASPVHRLGRGTSGLVLFARTPQAAAYLTACWNTDKVQKIYRALAQGVAERDAYDIRTPIGLVPHPRLGSVWAASAAGKASRSLARVIARAAAGGAPDDAFSNRMSDTTRSRSGITTFEVALQSGRPHQIRIHLASIGHPLVGDPLYGANGQPLTQDPGLPGDGGYFLHAQFLRFEHPVTRAAMHLEAPLPHDFSPS